VIAPALLERAATVLNLSGLARKAGMSNQTLISKLKRRTRFTEFEMKSINAALLRDGINIYQVNTKKAVERKPARGKARTRKWFGSGSPAATVVVIPTSAPLSSPRGSRGQDCESSPS
jgi:hypothetical protein